MPSYQDLCILQIDGVDLDDVIVELTESADVATKAVSTMNRVREAKGFKQGNSLYSLTAKVEIADDPRIPKWHDLLKQRKRFNILKRPNVGPEVSYQGCVITKIDDSNQVGDSMRTLNITALSRQ